MTSSRLFTLSLLVLLLLFSACTPAPTALPDTPTPSNTATETLTPTEAATQTPWVITAPSEPTNTVVVESRGVFFLALPDGGHTHLFAYSPGSLPLTRLTANSWDDVSPAVGPDGNWLAYASRQNGYWDLYLMSLQSGATFRLTDTLAYEGSPSWSPDGSWLAYETYNGNSMEIAIRSAMDPSSQPIQLTNDSSLDTTPAWSPRGRQIAFVSDRSGEPEIWIADLDNAASDQFVNISNSADTVEAHPAWSPDGNRLAWASSDLETGLTSVRVWDARTPEVPAADLASGDWPAWWDNGNVATRISLPNQNQLTAYEAASGLLSLPPILLPGTLEGFACATSTAPLPGPFAGIAGITPEPLYEVRIDPGADTLPGRTALVDLHGTQAVFPQMSDKANEAFAALRLKVAAETGWDALASLENAYVPLSTPLDPGLSQDWLYTGRAFTLNTALLQAGWLVVVREDYGQQTWWRVYLRTAAQDGSQGRPLTGMPWDFSARTGSSQAYESGGTLMETLPPGYWVDLTALAIEYGWERLPALTTWRTYYTGAHFNEFAFIQGMDWYAAMLELYPAAALMTPTIVIPPTRTNTRTPLYFRSPTPTRTPTPRPTNTP